jgi:hypothetical protein
MEEPKRPICKIREVNEVSEVRQWGTKKTPYIYTKQMAFLNDVLEYNRTTSSLDCNNKEQIQEAGINVPMMTEAVTLSQPGQSTSCKEKSFGKKGRLDPVESEIITALEANRAAKRMKENKSDDDDLNFLLFLLPTMQNVPNP